jgi:hypothetical protein
LRRKRETRSCICGDRRQTWIQFIYSLRECASCCDIVVCEDQTKYNMIRLIKQEPTIKNNVKTTEHKIRKETQTSNQFNSI